MKVSKLERRVLRGPAKRLAGYAAVAGAVLYMAASVVLADTLFPIAADHRLLVSASPAAPEQQARDLAPLPLRFSAEQPMALPATLRQEAVNGLVATMLSPAVAASESPVAPWARSEAPDETMVDVTARDDFFEPRVVTVTVGTVVRWTNRGVHAHSSTSADGYWSWGLVPGASFALRFLSPGTYDYSCVYHSDLGMTGTVIVTGSGPLATPTVGPGPVPGIDAETIVYDYFADEATRTRTDLFLVQPDGSNVRQLTDTADLAEAQPSWSPDRRRVAYTASTLDSAGSTWGLWVMDLVTGQRRQITSGPENYEPEWRPDGSLLVFTNIVRSGGVPVRSEIAVISPDGGSYRTLARVTSSSYGMVNPTWSPDGQRIAFGLGSNQAGGEMYVMNADGSNVERIMAHPGWDDIDPEWSPDGRYIAFSSGRVGMTTTRHDIWLLDLTTGLAGTIAQVPEWDLRRPAWSPEGDRIVFTARFQDNPSRWALYIVPATGGTVSGPLTVGVEPDWGSGAVLPLVTPAPTPTGTPPELPTPQPFPTFPPPGPTDPSPPPTFPPPEPTPTSDLPGPSATASATSTTPAPTPTVTSTTPAPTPSVIRGRVYFAIAYKP